MQQIGIAFEVGNLQHRHPALTHAKKFPRTAQVQVGLCDLETVARFIDDLEPRARQFRQGVLIEQDAAALCRAATDAPS